MSFVHEFTKLYAYREVLRNLVNSDLKLRFRRSFLGYGWSLLYPVLQMLILAVVFSRVMKFGSPSEMVPYIFAGLAPWNFFVSTCMAGGNSLLTNEALLKKIYLPKMIFPMAILLARLVDFLFNIAALFIIVSLISFKISWALLLLPVAIALLFLFVGGITIALSAVNVYMRDAAHLMSVVLQLAFYATPIIYREEILTSHGYGTLLEFNPLVHIIRIFHVIIADAQMPSLQQWNMAAAVAIGTAVLGCALFARLERNLIFRL
ncbi:MAG TPA: ABC transporter permease [Planctomycetota bacterium]|nr:ABC transporter permease [Planctomycetota bacterium]